MLINLLGQFNFQHGAFPLSLPSSFFFFFTFLPVNPPSLPPPLFLLSFPRESITANDLLTHFAGRHSPLAVLRIFLRKSMRSMRRFPLGGKRGERKFSLVRALIIFSKIEQGSKSVHGDEFFSPSAWSSGETVKFQIFEFLVESLPTFSAGISPVPRR